LIRTTRKRVRKSRSRGPQRTSKVQSVADEVQLHAIVFQSLRYALTFGL